MHLEQKDKLIKALRRKTIENASGREPPSLSALMDRAKSMIENPERFNTQYLKLIKEDLAEAYACLAAVKDAVENAPKLKRYRRPG